MKIISLHSLQYLAGNAPTVNNQVIPVLQVKIVSKSINKATIVNLNYCFRLLIKPTEG